MSIGIKSRKMINQFTKEIHTWRESTRVHFCLYIPCNSGMFELLWMVPVVSRDVSWTVWFDAVGLVVHFDWVEYLVRCYCLHYCWNGTLPFVTNFAKYALTFPHSCVSHSPWWHRLRSLESLRILHPLRKYFGIHEYQCPHHFYGGYMSQCTTK